MITRIIMNIMNLITIFAAEGSTPNLDMKYVLSKSRSFSVGKDVVIRGE